MSELDDIKSRWSGVTAPSQARADVRALLEEIGRLEERERTLREALDANVIYFVEEIARLEGRERTLQKALNTAARNLWEAAQFAPQDATRFAIEAAAEEARKDADIAAAPETP